MNLFFLIQPRELSCGPKRQFEPPSGISKEIGFIINVAASGLKVKQKYESIQLLSNLKMVLEEKLKELKKGKKNNRILGWSG